MLEAVTFDFWDTLAVDESDEAHRRGRGLASKSEARIDLLVERFAGGPAAGGREALREAYEEAREWCLESWRDRHRTPTLPERLDRVCRTLGVDPPVGFERLVEAFGAMEVEVPPDPVPGLHECVAALCGRVRLGVISDTVVTPGRGLRAILAGWGILDSFDVLVFSDEVGASKPAPRVFEGAIEALGTTPERLVHVGDREETDVAGALGVGAGAVLFTGIHDRGSARTRAGVVCDDLRALPALLEEWDSRTGGAGRRGPG